MLPATIKHIILDLGGVIINLDTQKPFLTLKELFSENFNNIEKSYKEINLFNEFEVGNISENQFVEFFLKYNKKVSSNQLIDAWNSMLLDIPKERILLIKQLNLKYNVFLLSNTNETHLKHINNYLFDSYKIPTINSMFKKAYFSHQVGLRKPNPAIFNLVLNENKLNPSETLFVDDSTEHIQAAQQLGIQTKHLVNQNLTTYFNEH